MKATAFWLALAVLVVAGREFEARATDCAELVGSCNYYLCLSEKLSCDAAAMINSTSSHYCREYELNSAAFSGAGQSVLHKIKTCLQQEIEAHDPQTCGDAGHAFVRAHLTCYVSEGYCGLEVADKYKVLRYGFAALTNFSLLTAATEISWQCRQKNFGDDPIELFPWPGP